jgi:hypothetical protein
LQNEIIFVTAQKRHDSKALSETVTINIVLEPCRFVSATQEAFVETTEPLSMLCACMVKVKTGAKVITIKLAQNASSIEGY